jgi:cysteinyl-tRNA synthetase
MSETTYVTRAGSGAAENARQAIRVPRVEALIAERTAAKKDRNFSEADRIRAELAAHDIVLEDSASGTTWRRR